MLQRTLILFLLLSSISLSIRAELTPWRDYDISESLYLITTIKIEANMGDVYLEGLRNTWIPRNEVAKELGHIKDYKIYRSDPFEGSGFNLLLVVIFNKTEDIMPSRERYMEFIKKWGQENEQKKTAMREQNILR